ncbi:MAG: beta-lactamase family protein [Dysgonamonadaceae bacterium]|jgi:CubicO group peptidase (beta-lactamase class C family)|nr:beta-lactamase family protein [Dysgonamonadaceae bacterium]
MRTLFSFIIFTISVSLFAQTKPQSFDYKKPSSTENRWVYIDQLLQEYVDKGILPHALTFVAQKGVVLHNETYGWRNIKNKSTLKRDDIFRNYSQTKAITTVALMTLFERGKFLLDDPVSKYIPEFKDEVLDVVKADGTYTTRKAKSPLLIRHLLCHTSGILGNKDLQIIRKEQLKRRENRPYKTLAEEVKDILQLPLAFDPGTEWNYHPSSDIWGYLVELFSGKSLRDYVKEAILIPLDMKDTDWYYPNEYKTRMVTAYSEIDNQLSAQTGVWSGRDPFSRDTRYCQAGTGLNGTIEDYAKFCQMILNGGSFNGKQILSRRTIEMMSVDQLPHPNSGGPGFCFGIGFQVLTGNDTERVKSATPMVPGGALTWGGMYNTDYLIDPKNDVIILLYTNRIPDTKVWEKFLTTVYQALN